MIQRPAGRRSIRTAAPPGEGAPQVPGDLAEPSR